MPKHIVYYKKLSCKGIPSLGISATFQVLWWNHIPIYWYQNSQDKIKEKQNSCTGCRRQIWWISMFSLHVCMCLTCYSMCDCVYEVSVKNTIYFIAWTTLKHYPWIVSLLAWVHCIYLVKLFPLLTSHFFAYVAATSSSYNYNYIHVYLLLLPLCVHVCDMCSNTIWYTNRDTDLHFLF